MSAWRQLRQVISIHRTWNIEHCWACSMPPSLSQVGAPSGLFSLCRPLPLTSGKEDITRCSSHCIKILDLLLISFFNLYFFISWFSNRSVIICFFACIALVSLTSVTASSSWTLSTFAFKRGSSRAAIRCRSLMWKYWSTMLCNWLFSWSVAALSPIFTWRCFCSCHLVAATRWMETTISWQHPCCSVKRF